MDIEPEGKDREEIVFLLGQELHYWNEISRKDKRVDFLVRSAYDGESPSGIGKTVIRRVVVHNLADGRIWSDTNDSIGCNVDLTTVESFSFVISLGRTRW